MAVAVHQTQSRSKKTPNKSVRNQPEAGLNRMWNAIRLAMIVIMLGHWVQGVASEVPIAGLAPQQRPAGAPVITSYEKNGAWYRQALHGISEPYPASLRFLEDQGPWHTPFNVPGMTGPYDIRGWHQPSPALPSN